MLNERGAEFTYREYTKDPLSADEIRDVLAKLGLGPRDILRSRDAKKLEIDASMGDDALIDQMSQHPGLIQRPIGVVGDRAKVGRPVENLLELL